MSNPFLDLQQFLTNATGIDFVLSGIILGTVFTVGLFIILVVALDPKAKGKDSFIMLISAGIGVVISTAVGWFPIWITIFIAIILAFILIDPYGHD